MMATLSKSLKRVPQLDAFKTLILALSAKLGTNASSPRDVLRNFVDFLQHANPRFRLLLALLTPWAMLLTAISRYELIQGAFSAVKGFITDSLYSSVSIPASHPLNKQILAYMVERLGKNARSLAVSPPSAAMRPGYSNYDLYESLRYPYTGSQKVKRLPSPEEEEKQRHSLNFVPDVGTYAFWYQGYRMTFERQTYRQQQYDLNGKLRLIQAAPGNETIIITCLSPFSGAQPIKNFLNHIKSTPLADHTTTIYRPEGQIWDQGITRPSRNLNAVTLDSSVKDDIVKDVETYLAPETRKYYANRGIPWRRGLLFYGNPGCGKTSFTNALAGHFNLNVYMISLSTHRLSDDILESLFEQLPARCIVLLEDIDSAGIKRDDMRAQQAKVKEKTKRHRRVYDEYGNRVIYHDPADVAGGGVTLSGLLNVLDGIYSKEGMVTIMTSNSPDSLDPALVRPGRIDRKILFGYASREVIAKLFQHIFSKLPEEQLEGEEKDSGHDIAALAETFATKVPADKLTPAEVQGYLLVRRTDPVGAVEGAAEWAEKTLETKAKGANVATFERDGNLDKAEKNSAPHTAPPVPPPPSNMFPSRNHWVTHDDSSSSMTEDELDPSTSTSGAEGTTAETSSSSPDSGDSKGAGASGTKAHPKALASMPAETRVMLQATSSMPTPPMSRSESQSSALSDAVMNGKTPGSSLGAG